MCGLVYLLGFLLLGVEVIHGQEVNFIEAEWSEAANRAALEGKAVFVDVYTDWCAPCKQMDQTTFKNSEVAAFFNQEYISIKINAEDNGSGAQMARRYSVGSYPTLLFLTSAGELISHHEGMKTDYEILDIGRSSKRLFESLDYIRHVKQNLSAAYTPDQLGEILDLTTDHPFDGKARLSMQYLDLLDEVTETDLRRVMGAVQEMDVDHLRRVAPMILPLTYDEMRVRRNSQEWIAWRTSTENSLYELINRSIEKADFQSFEAALDILKGPMRLKPKQVDKLYYKYYRRNNLEQFRQFASYMINEHIIPSEPKAVALADEQKYQLIQAEVEQSLARLEGSDVQIEYADATSQTPTIDSLAEIYTISRSIANELYEVSSDFFAFYEDESSRRKSDFWASLAYRYYPYDYKYYENHIYILQSLNKPNEAQRVEQELQRLPWYGEMMIQSQNQAW
ncbi:MAG: thioredoxin family protein [Bacteroidota bacterium]